jgi:hypothetical protein
MPALTCSLVAAALSDGRGDILSPGCADGCAGRTARAAGRSRSRRRRPVQLPAQPLQQLRTLGVRRVGQHHEQALVPVRAAADLRRAGAGTVEAPRRPGTDGGEPLTDPDVVLPAVAEVVLVPDDAREAAASPTVKASSSPTGPGSPRRRRSGPGRPRTGAVGRPPSPSRSAAPRAAGAASARPGRAADTRPVAACRAGRRSARRRPTCCGPSSGSATPSAASGRS